MKIALGICFGDIGEVGRPIGQRLLFFFLIRARSSQPFSCADQFQFQSSDFHQQIGLRSKLHQPEMFAQSRDECDVQIIFLQSGKITATHRVHFSTSQCCRK